MVVLLLILLIAAAAWLAFAPRAKTLGALRFAGFVLVALVLSVVLLGLAADWMN